MTVPKPLSAEEFARANQAPLSIARRAEAEITRHVLLQARRSQPLTLLALLLFSAMLYPVADHFWLASWTLASAAIMAARWYSLRYFVRHEYPDSQMACWNKPLIIGAIFSGAYWAALVGFAVIIDDHAYERTIMVLLCGAIAAGLAVLGAKRSVFLAFSLPIVISLVAYSLAIGGSIGYSIATLVVVFYLLILSAEHRYQQAMLDAIATRLKNHSLIEELAEARDRAERSSRIKSEFLANMSHEIRTPMNGVSGILQILNDTTLSSEQRQFVEAGLRSSERLMGLLSHILDVSRIEAGALGLAEEDFDLHALCDEVLDLHRASALNKGLSLIPLIDERLPSHIHGDSHRLAQVLNNLLGNAIKFTREGYVEFEASRGGPANTRRGRSKETLVFSISDSGCGIDADKLESIFEAFVQGDPSTTRRYGGSGLGLTICKQLTELMGGEIEVSTSETGSRFSITLPMIYSHEKHHISTPFAPRPSSPYPEPASIHTCDRKSEA